MNTATLYAIQYPDGTYYPKGVELNKARFFHLAASAKAIITGEKYKARDWHLAKFNGKMVKVDITLDARWSNG